VLAHIGAFPNKCTKKTPFLHKGYMKSMECYEKCMEKKPVDNIILNQNHGWHIIKSG
jgi:hypothetical protein